MRDREGAGERERGREGEREIERERAEERERGREGESEREREISPGQVTDCLPSNSSLLVVAWGWGETGH